ncbi:uncharacterized protein LOC127867994 isoform X2 [Dreissena polymorpha]|uniref:uncharacterized protein LOC127867994 isoform X2 n=1 Tax=Dreissena polymorpha TaxID=45954 RepID=UPI002263B3E3|nr:uncharacterized protein LOC127867994 isoform X2 [Dreissena polymorpha]
MSRGPRDLRDLICVSRLTFRKSDDEVSSDDDKFNGDWNEISVGSSGSCDSRQDLASANQTKAQSPDSGCITNGGSPLDSGSVKDTELKLDLSSLHKNKKKAKKKKKKVMVIGPAKIPFPKAPPLPPVKSGSSESGLQRETFLVPAPPPADCKLKQTVHIARYVGSKPVQSESQKTGKLREPSSKHEGKAEQKTSTLKESNEKTEDKADLFDVESEPVRAKTPVVTTSRVKASDAESGNYDEMLSFMDATVVSSWLTKANKSVSEIASYITADDHFVQFAHFWLSDFPDSQKREIFELEIEILREEIGFAFAVGREEGKVSQRDISNLIGAIFREYPVKLLSSRGTFLFLDYLDIVTSGRTEKYKQLLSDVKCSTKNRQYAQWLLATRSFALVSIWCAIVNFYRNLLGRHGNSKCRVPEVPSSYRTVYERRLFQGFRRGFVDVVHYLHIGKYVDLHMVDSHERTLIFTAVMHNQPKILQYLVLKVKPPININHVSDTGNTALHAAVNSGNTQLVSILLKGHAIDVNCLNSQCENATPLHLAVMHGQKEIVELLLSLMEKLGLMHACV